MILKIGKVIVILTLIGKIHCELTPEAIKNLLQGYSTSVNSSVRLSKSEKKLIDSWSEDIQIKRINVTTKFRLQMMRHKEHSFSSDINKKWLQCMDIYATEISASERIYSENENNCLRAVNKEDIEKKSAVEQVEKEIKRWRRSYKYLVHLCSINYPDDEDSAGSCLVGHIEKDNYNNILQRLMLMKVDAMNELRVCLIDSMVDLEDCLKLTLSLYLDKVRFVMEKLNRCYNGNKKI